MLFNIINYSNQVIGQVEADNAVEAWSEAGKRYENVLDVREVEIGIPLAEIGPVEHAVTGILAAAERIKGRELPLETRALIYSESGTLVSHSVSTLDQAIEDAGVFRNAGMGVKIMFEPHPHYCSKPWEVVAHPISFHEMVAGVELEDAREEVHIKGIGKYPMLMLTIILEDYDRKYWPGFDRLTCSFR